MIRTVIVFDQFWGPTPYSLQQHPVPFRTLIADVQHGAYNVSAAPWRNPKILNADDDFRPEYASTVVAEGPDGNAVVWKHRWDSSG